MVDDTEVADRRAELPEPLPVVKQKKKWYRVCTMHLAVDFAELKEQLCVVPIHDMTDWPGIGILSKRNFLGYTSPCLN